MEPLVIDPFQGGVGEPADGADSGFPLFGSKAGLHADVAEVVLVGDAFDAVAVLVEADAASGNGNEFRVKRPLGGSTRSSRPRG